MNDPIRDELHRLAEEFKKLAGESAIKENNEITTPKQLVKFGLTLDEAKSWLERETNFMPADEKKHLNGTDEDEIEPYAETIEGSLSVLAFRTGF